MKHNLIAIIAFLILFIGVSCDRPSDQLNDQPSDRSSPSKQEQLIESEENKDYRVPIDYDIEDEVLPEGY